VTLTSQLGLKRIKRLDLHLRTLTVRIFVYFHRLLQAALRFAWIYFQMAGRLDLTLTNPINCCRI